MSMATRSGTLRLLSARRKLHGPTWPAKASARSSGAMGVDFSVSRKTTGTATSSAAAIQRRARGGAGGRAGAAAPAFAGRAGFTRSLGCQGHLGNANTSASAAMLSQPSHSVMPRPVPM
ncbi:hypothetical protein D3C86_1460840 [compost metagenome]